MKIRVNERRDSWDCSLTTIFQLPSIFCEEFWSVILTHSDNLLPDKTEQCLGIFYFLFNPFLVFRVSAILIYFLLSSYQPQN